ncbi:MAG: DedA family protein [Candidatus Paceibacterota bacterium]|jgi:membrane protein DedA with SNARE-associated domain
MEALIQNIVWWIDSSKYFLLFLGCIFEGPIVMLTSGFLYHLGQFNFWQMYFALVLGDFTADIIWYCIGRYGTRDITFKYGKFFGLTPETLAKVEGWFTKYHQKILIISKLTTGFGFAVAVLVTAGMFKVPFKKYLILTLFGGFIWTAMLITIGYFFGNIFILIPGSMKIIFLVIIFLIFVFGIKFLNNRLKNIKI